MFKEEPYVSFKEYYVSNAPSSCFSSVSRISNKASRASRATSWAPKCSNEFVSVCNANDEKISAEIFVVWEPLTLKTILSGQITTLHKPRFPWNKGLPLPKLLPFGDFGRWVRYISILRQLIAGRFKSVHASRTAQVAGIMDTTARTIFLSEVQVLITSFQHQPRPLS